MFVEDFIDDWVLVRTPYPVAIVLTTYLLVVFKVGPYFMRHRKPLELQNTMRIYNVFQMLINAYQFYSVSARISHIAFEILFEYIHLYSTSAHKLLIKPLSFLSVANRILTSASGSVSQEEKFATQIKKNSSML